MKRMMMVIALCLMTGCGAVLTAGSDSATLTGSPEGIRAMLDGMNGMIVNGKASPDKRTPAIAMRMEQEKEITKRSMARSFFSDIFARQSASNVTNIDTSTVEK